MRKLSREEFVTRLKADMNSKRQARLDAESAWYRYVQDKDAKYMRRKKKYMVEK